MNRIFSLHREISDSMLRVIHWSSVILIVSLLWFGWSILAGTFAALWIGFIALWMISVGKFLFDLIPNIIKMPWNVFLMNNILILLSGIVLLFPVPHPLVYLLGIYLLFGLGFSIQFIAKCLVAFEEQRSVDYFDYKFTFFRCCTFFPFSLVALSKRIHELAIE